MIVIKEESVFRKIEKLWERNQDRGVRKTKKVFLSPEEWEEFEDTRNKRRGHCVYGLSMNRERNKCHFGDISVELIAQEEFDKYPECFHE